MEIAFPWSFSDTSAMGLGVKEEKKKLWEHS
jgi:hypothetical protein